MGPNSGMAKTWVRRPMTEVPTPIAISADIRGSSAHRIDRRKAKNSTTSDSRTPSTSLNDCLVLSLLEMAWPPSCTLSDELSAD